MPDPGNLAPERYWKLLPPLLLIASNLFVFTPFAIYHGSPREFDAGFGVILVYHLVPLVGAVGIGLAAASRLGRRGARTLERTVALLFALGV